MIKIILILLIISEARTQMLPVRENIKVLNWQDADTVDGNYAIMRAEGYRVILEYDALRTINVNDHFTLYVHARLPVSADFVVTLKSYLNNWSVLYTYKGIPTDQPGSLIDTTIVIDVPSGSIFHYGKPFNTFGVIRDYQNNKRSSREDFYIDGLVLQIQDTIIIRDTVVVPDTVRMSVAPFVGRRSDAGARYDVLGRRADKYTRVWFEQDSTGRYRVRVK